MSKKRPSRSDRLETALDTIRGAVGDIEELRDEITSWKEGMEGTNLETTQKHSDLEECEQSLDSLIDEINSTVDSASVDFPGMF